MQTKEIAKDLYWVGTLDPDLKVFDIIMETKYGTSYNSYLLKGSEKSVLFETTKEKYFESYLETLQQLVSIQDIEYIVIDHTEPDHAGSIGKMLDQNPKIKLVGSAAAINFVKEICNRDFTSVIVKEGDTLSLGDKTLRFLSVPNLHWPDTIYTYIEEDKALITCDSFGTHYCLDAITNDKIENQDDYMESLRYYFDNIMGPFKPYVLDAVNKIKNLPIDVICPGHGPVLVENPMKIVEIYRQWSVEVNPNEKKTVIIPYVSAYGYTKMLAEKIREGIVASGDIDVKLHDMVDADYGLVVEELKWADGILLGTPTIIGEALKPIWDLTSSIFAKTHGKKLAAAFGSYGWSGEGVPHMMERLRQLGMNVYGTGLRVKFKPSASQLQDAYEFGYNFGASVLAGKIVEAKKDGFGYKRLWKCLVCGEIVEGDEPPEACPVCGVGPEQFVEVDVEEISYHKDTEENFLIIGNGAAGTAACEEIRLRNSSATIEMISDESTVGYNRPMLTKGIMSTIDALNFYIKPESWYQENRIKITLNQKVKSIDPKAKTVTLESGETRRYDKLILATGADSFIPPIPGTDQKGVIAIRNLADTNQIQEALKKAKAAAVIGGGVLGLEAAWQISKAGIPVTVIELAPQLMGRQLDEKASILLRKAVEAAGIETYVGVGIERIAGENGRAQGVKLADGTVVAADLVIMSTGVRPSIALAKDAEVPTGRSILVNEKMETGADSIYACGDCAEYEGVNFAIWPEALEMGKVAGANATGDNCVYNPVIPANAFAGMNTALFAIGDNGKDPEKKYKSIELLDDAKGTYEKLYFLNNRFCGGILLGDVNQSPKLIEGYQEQKPLAEMMEII